MLYLLYVFLFLSFTKITPSNSNYFSYELSINQYLSIFNFFNQTATVNIILSIKTTLPYDKMEASKCLNNSAIRMHMMVNVIAVETNGSDCNIGEYLLHINARSVIMNNTRLNTFDCLHKPLLTGEYELLSKFSISVLKSLRKFVKKEFLAEFNESCNDYQCFTFMPSSPLYTKRWGNKRQSWLRLNRNKCPFISNPIDLQMLIDHSSNNFTNWNLSSIWFHDQFYDLNQLKNQPLETYSLSKWPYPNGEKPKIHHKCKNGIPDEAINICRNGATKYRNWDFYYQFSDEIGVKLMNIKFRGVSIAFELSLSEIVTSYSGHSPFIQTLTAIESMYGIGMMISELSPNIDCPDNAHYISLNRRSKTSNKLIKVKNAMCIFSRKSTKPLRRHFEFDDSEHEMKFASAVPSFMLYVRFIVSMFNYDYIFDYILHDSGVIDISVTPTGYIHVDSYNNANLTSNPQLTKFGYAIKSLNLLFPIHQHLFLFKLDLDVIESKNNFHIIEVIYNESEPMGKNLWLQDKLIEYENSSTVNFDFKTPKYILICKDSMNKSNCMQIINKSMIPDLLSEDISQSINWKKYQLAVSKRRLNESRGSSIFNGVNLVNSVVDFDNFLSNNDPLVNEDLIVWTTVGSVHVPTVEDTPNTITSSNEMKITLRPFNLFDESAQGKSQEEFYTRNIADWQRGLRCDTKKRLKTIKLI